MRELLPIYLAEKEEELLAGAAVRSIIGRRKWHIVFWFHPFKDDDYVYVCVAYAKGRPRYQVFSGASLRPTTFHYEGSSLRKAYRKLFDLRDQY